MPVIKNRTPKQTTAYVVLALAAAVVILWFVFLTPIWRLFGS